MLPGNFPILGNMTSSVIQSVIQVLNCPIFGTQTLLFMHPKWTTNVSNQNAKIVVQKYNTQRTLRPQLSTPKYHKSPSYSRYILHNPYFSSGCALKQIYVPPNSRPGTTSYQTSNVSINTFNVLLRTVPANGWPQITQRVVHVHHRPNTLLMK